MTRAAYFDREKEAGQVYVHHQLPVGEAHLVDGTGTHDAGIGDDDVDPAELRHDAIKERLHRRFVGDIDGLCDDAAAGFLGQLVRYFLRLRELEIGDDNVGPFDGETTANGGAQTLGAAGDDSNTILKLAHSSFRLTSA